VNTHIANHDTRSIGMPYAVAPGERLGVRLGT